MMKKLHMVIWFGVLGAAFAQAPQWPKTIEQQGTCKVLIDDGTIDLSPLDTKEPNNPRFKNIAGTDIIESVYDYNPCSGFTVPQNGTFSCKDVAVCQMAASTTVYPAGDANSATFFTDNTYGLCIKYDSSIQDPNLCKNPKRTTYIQLICDKDEDGRLTVIGETDHYSCIYVLKLTSKFACASGSTPPIPGPGLGQPDPCTWWRYAVFFLATINSLCLIVVIIGLLRRR